jgi:hypothetical protein
MVDQIKQFFSNLTMPSFHEILMDADNHELINSGANRVVYGSTALAGGGLIFGLTPEVWISLGFFAIALSSAIFNAWFKMKYQKGDKK